MTEEKTLLTERRGHVLLLTLNRHAKRNALDMTLMRSLVDALRAADADPEVRCVVITARGTCFCAGADLDEGRAIPRERADLLQTRADLLVDINTAVARMSTPVIAAVNGPAIGAGAGLSLGCDLVVASPAARFGYPEVKHGISAGLLIPNLIRQVGPKPAFELVATGDPIDAERAYALGMINRIVPAEELTTSALALAERLAQFAPAGLMASKRAFQQAYDLPMEEAVWAARDTNDRIRAASD
ncbi:MAG: enoyl-CoA hydratase/isomerase family protein [Pigmentiphaga sp.]|uniref:enoyl-CoA hydratase/isomerase family protein n=1 Tax=Pigmentiphaga sp. TaxID=1977564 RepID=UPI0029A13ACF|nr:enoyl-CoA hydratase/isomerase family protein [Pigmentiphaga sp.]MDX3908115.1 enoyl-CoA hydratase/isomerase family protein [Pigmentiphaga sp.]